MQALVTAEGNTAIVTEVPIPVPGHREILIKVESIAINPIEPAFVARPADKPGRVIGSDIAGIVESLGPDVTKWSVGDRVAGILQGATSGNYRPGGFAEYAVVEEDFAIRIPDQVSFDEAATLPVCALTAAQALFIRLEINAPFASPFQFPPESRRSPAVLIYSAATSLGLFCIELLKLVKTPEGNPYRIFATASPKNYDRLRALGVEKVYDYRSPDWPATLLRDSGGITHAVDCISEDDSTAKISQSFGSPDTIGSKIIAAVRRTAWNKEGVRPDVTVSYSAAWSGLGHEIMYFGETLPASPAWRQFTTAFYKFLSTASEEKLPIAPNPIRLMPGGLKRIVPDAFTLMGSGKVADRVKEGFNEPWMLPISAEKLVYRLA